MNITPEASAAFYEAKGLAAGEQADEQADDLEPDELDDERIPCACRDHFLYGADDECPACDGTGFVDVANEWCDRCGLHGRCPWCDPDRYRDERDDR